LKLWSLTKSKCACDPCNQPHLVEKSFVVVTILTPTNQMVKLA